MRILTVKVLGNEENFILQVVSKKDRALDAKGSCNTKDIRIESFDVAYGEKYVFAVCG